MKRQAPYIVAGMAILSLILLIMWLLFGEQFIRQLSPPQLKIEEPQQLTSKQEHAVVRGQLDCSCDTNDLDVLVYVKYNSGNTWYRSDKPEQAMRRWSIPANYITFPVTHSNFTLVAIVASSDEARYTPRTLQANDVTDFRKKMLEGGYVYKNDRNYMSPELPVSRIGTVTAPTLTSIRPTGTSTPTPTNTSTATPTNTLTPTPTNTPTPSPAPTPTATDTPTATQPPRTPTTPVPTTPAVSRAPTLLTPENGRCYDGNVTFSWHWYRSLSNEGEYGGEYFALRVWREGKEKQSIAWVKETSYVLPLEPPYYVGDPNIRYLWNVAVVRQIGPNRSEEWKYVSPESEYWWFCIHSVAPEPPTPTLPPTVTPSPEPL
jgi:hypothetical protein